MKRDFVSFSTFSKKELMEIFDRTSQLKHHLLRNTQPMSGKTAALIFEKQSLRTRVSFEVGMAQLGGQSVFLSQQNIGLSTRESVRDIAEVLSQYNDLIIARTMSHETVKELATYADVPVINALTDLLHPCQIMADAFTLMERNMFNESTKISFIGDGNNIVNSWLEFAEKLPFHFVVACPKGYEPDSEILSRARASGVIQITITDDPLEAAHDANVLYADVWVSMGQEAEMETRMRVFQQYQINDRLLELADPDCLVMHCLPAHRGQEITAEVLEGNHSIVLEEAENRLHVQKGIISFLMDAQHSQPLHRYETIDMATD